ncbi:MAG: YjbQ family protein, partial [Flavobacteriaceae bacterium]
MTYQVEITLKPFSRGFHLITDDIIAVLPDMTGIVHVFIKHTSASLTINENADPSVRVDFETHFNKMVSESDDHYTHTL